MEQTLGVRAFSDYRDALRTTDLVLLCVKPSQVAGVLATIRDSALPSDALLVSILAGVTTGPLEAALGRANPWVRAVPNTPCVVGQGMTTVQRGGILLREKPPEVVAELLGRVAADGALRRAVLATQERAVAAVRAIDFSALLRERMAPVLGP